MNDDYAIQRARRDTDSGCKFYRYRSWCAKRGAFTWDAENITDREVMFFPSIDAAYAHTKNDYDLFDNDEIEIIKVERSTKVVAMFRDDAKRASGVTMNTVTITESELYKLERAIDCVGEFVTHGYQSCSPSGLAYHRNRATAGVEALRKFIIDGQAQARQGA